tara:strand:- start:309 stop:569 length:261 start_codon:yes stop_codon:yes gene_type:complete
MTRHYYPDDRDEPRETERSLSGYKYDPHADEWTRLIQSSTHTARRDHSTRRIKKGDRYTKRTWRHINDKTGKSRHTHRYDIEGGAK